MKNIILIIVCLATTIGMTSCYSGQKLGEGKKILLSETQLALIDTSFFLSSTIVPLETTENSIIQKINRICLSGDTLFVLDSKQGKVVIFDTKGHYLGKIHNIGNGPKEYIQVSDISIHPLKRCIVLLCSQPYKVIYYTYQGDFIEEATYSDYYSELFIQRETLYCYDSGIMGKKKIAMFTPPMKWEKNIDLEQGLFFDAESEGQSYHFSNGKRTTVSGDITFTWPFDYSIYSIKDGEVYEKYRIDFKERQVPKSIFSENLSPADFIEICHKKDYLYTIENVVENSNYLFFGTNKGMCIYNKGENKLTGYNFIVNSVLQAGEAAYLPLNNSALIAQVWQVDNFKRRIDERKAREGDLRSINKRYMQVYESAKEEDNPILMIYELPH